MSRWILALHILGWAQWMAAHTALAGLLRREALHKDDIGAIVAPQLKALWLGLWVGVGLTLLGGIWAMIATPTFAKMGFVHTKITLALILIAIAAGPLRTALKRMPVGGPPLKGLWFGISLALFMIAIVLGAVKPF